MANKDCLSWNSCVNLSTPENLGKPISVKICSCAPRLVPKKVICYRKSGEQEDWSCHEADSYILDRSVPCGTYKVKVESRGYKCYKHIFNPQISDLTLTFSGSLKSYFETGTGQFINNTVGGLEYTDCDGNQRRQATYFLTAPPSTVACYTENVFDSNADYIDTTASEVIIKSIQNLNGSEMPCTIKLYSEDKVLVHEKTFNTGCPEVKKEEIEACVMKPSKEVTIKLIPPEYLYQECYHDPLSLLPFAPPQGCVRVYKYTFSFDPITNLWEKLFPTVVFSDCAEKGCGNCPEVKTSCSDCGDECPPGTCMECPDGSGNTCCIGEDGSILAVIQTNKTCSDGMPPAI